MISNQGRRLLVAGVGGWDNHIELKVRSQVAVAATHTGAKQYKQGRGRFSTLLWQDRGVAGGKHQL